MRRREFLATVAAGLTAGTAGCLSASALGGERTVGDPIPAGPTVGLEAAVDGTAAAEANLAQPVDLAVVEPGRWLVADRAGHVLARDERDGLRTEPALDLRDRVRTDGEQGLLGLALHPDGDGRLYVRYSSPPREGTPDAFSHTAVLSEWQLTADRTAVRPGSERVVLEVPEPGVNHNGGAVAFGPDGLLYVSLGDGGWLEYPVEELPPGHATDWYGWNDGNNGQDVTENLLGSVLRIDVDAAPTEHPRTDGDAPEDPRPDDDATAPDGDISAAAGVPGYAIPADNPLVGAEGRDEQYAWGLRNPWRMGFSGDRLIVGDVGEYSFEEVDVVESGGNYGWNVREGRHCFDARNPTRPGPWCPAESPRGRALREPVLAYPHRIRTPDGVQKRHAAVVGGYVYEGDAVPAIAGEYVFGDFAGRLFVATPAGDRWEQRVLQIERGSGRRGGGERSDRDGGGSGDGGGGGSSDDAGESRDGLDGVVQGFARDAAGELLVLLVGAESPVQRVVPAGETA